MLLRRPRKRETTRKDEILRLLGEGESKNQETTEKVPVLSNSNLPSPVPSNHKIIPPTNYHTSFYEASQWIEQLSIPKPSGPDPFPLRKPRYNHKDSKPEENILDQNSDAVDAFFKSASYKILQLNHEIDFENQNSKSHRAEDLSPKKLVLSKNSCEKLTTEFSKNIEKVTWAEFKEEYLEIQAEK